MVMTKMTLIISNNFIKEDQHLTKLIKVLKPLNPVTRMNKRKASREFIREKTCSIQDLTCF